MSCITHTHTHDLILIISSGFNFFYDIISYHDEEIKKRKRFHILHQIILLLGHLKPLLLNRLIISLPFIHIFVTLINSIDESINRSWSNHFLNNSCVYLIIFFANKQTKIWKFNRFLRNTIFHHHHANMMKIIIQIFVGIHNVMLLVSLGLLKFRCTHFYIWYQEKNSNQFNSIRIRPSVCVCHFDRSDNCSMNDMKIALVYFCTKEHYVQLLIQNSIQYNSVCIDQRC